MPLNLEKFFGERELNDWLEWPKRGRFFQSLDIPAMRAPKMDVYETDKDVVAEVELPGVDPKNIDIEVRGNVLRVEAKTEEKKEKTEKGYFRKEISKGYFKRAVSLPVEVIEEKADAVYKEGILKVVIPKIKPKKEDKRSVKIKVKGVKTA